MNRQLDHSLSSQVWMAHPACRRHAARMALLALATVLGSLAAFGAPSRTLAQDLPTAFDPSLPYISEVSPVGGAGATPWVEITMGRAGSGTVPNDVDRVYMPLIHGMDTAQAATLSAQAGQAAQAGAQAATEPSNIHGWHLRDGDGNDYDLPFGLGTAAPGVRILVLYDGKGPGLDDLDHSDGLATVHTPPGLTNPFESAGDQLSLFDAANKLVDFVAWGQPAGSDDDAAAAAALWTAGNFVVYDGGTGAGQVNAPNAPNRSIGVWHSETGAAAAGNENAWYGYAEWSSTPGALNPPPAPLHSLVPDDATIGIGPDASLTAADAAINFSMVELRWTGADTKLNFQVELLDPDTMLPAAQRATALPGIALELGEGTHLWRVRSVDSKGNFSAWLGPFKVNVVDLGQFTGLGTLKKLLKTSEYKIQHKDSTMLDIGGGENNVVGSGNPGDRRYPDDRRWDGEHVDANGAPRFGWNGIDNWYCVRASTAMINDYFGGNLTQDRLSMYAFEQLADNWYGSPVSLRGIPENDLGFAIGIGSYSIQEKVLSWALGGVGVTPINYCPNPGTAGYTCPNPAGAPMSFADIKSFIDAGRPFVSVNLNNAHARVVDGYWEISANSRWVHLIDPVPADTGACPTCTNAQWLAYTTFTNNHERAIVPPAAVPSPRQMEASLLVDSDGDGINDYDETVRFKTNPNNPDSDGDWVDDKNDMAEYIFNTSSEGTYVYTPGMSPKTSDFDGDGKRKELDPDNDNDGSLDGCEDLNQDGEFDGLPETNNFFGLGGLVCQPRFAILDPITGQAKNAGDPANPDKVLIRLKLALPPALTPVPNFTNAQFAVTIGGLAAPIVNGARVGQEYWVLVQAPVQPSSAYYTLQVNFDGTPTGHNDQSDSEANAVFYIPRPRVDTLVVLDRSGSMLDANKLTSAKNAARLYIDQWAVNDRVGVVTFGDTATTPMALAVVVTGTQTLTDAKNIINAAPGGGQTAMGPGLLAGQTQLTTNGDATHQWALMLVTDGEENVAPLWAEPAVSGVIIPSQTVVHTVGVGQPNDLFFDQLAQIAGSTGGGFAAVDDPSLVAAASPLAPDAVTLLPASTANRLADAYKWAAEQTLREQRLFEGTGTLNASNTSDTYRFHVPDVRSVLFTANFDAANAGRLIVRDPGGATIIPGAFVQRRTDLTHDQYRVAGPTPGLWSVVIERSNPSATTEYLFFASSQTDVTLNLVAGEAKELSPGSTARAAQIPIAAFLASDVPIKGAQVAVEVQRPAPLTPLTLTLLDDGAHGDGVAGDGIYGGVLILPYQGPYLVKAKATMGPANSPAQPAASYRFAQLVVNP